MGHWFLSSLTLTRREVVRFLRQRSRLMGALGTPLVFWFLMGSGFRDAVEVGGRLNYLQYFFPGTVLLILFFTAIFSTISIIEDRNEGFLQSVLVSPAPRSSIVFGKLMGGTVLAVLQGTLFLIMAPFLGIPLSVLQFFHLFFMMALISFGLTGLGFVIAWRMNSTQGFHAIMNLFLMPLWLLSGALFPLGSVPAWLGKIMIFNPLTYSAAALNNGFFGPIQRVYPFLNSHWVCFGVCLAFAGILTTISTRMVRSSS